MILSILYHMHIDIYLYIYIYIGARVKGLRRPAKKKQKKPPDSPGSTQYINNSPTLFHFMQFCLGNSINYFW